MTTSIRLVDGTTTVWLRPEIPSAADPIVCQDHSLSSAARRETIQPRPGRSGLLDLTAYTDDAVFQANLYVCDSGGVTRHQRVDQLRAMLHPRRRPWLYIQRDGWLAERRAEIRGASLTNPIDAKSALGLEVSLQVDIPDGVLEAVTEQSDTIRPGSTAAGLSLPISLPASFTPGSSGAVKIINLGGSEYGVAPTPLLMRLYGACTEPVITNQTLGEVFELDNVTLAAGQYLEIDMGAKTVLLNGDPALSYYSRINFATSTWWELQPGDNLLSVGAATLDASCELDLFWTARFSC